MANTVEKKAEIGQQASFWRKLVGAREFSLFVIIAVFFVFLTLTQDVFLTWLNLKTMLVSMSTTGMTVIAMAFVMLTGGIDLAVGATMCLAMAIGAVLFKGGMNPWVASVIAIFSGVVIGWIQGMLITKIKLIHFIVTMCFMGICRGLVMYITKGTPISLVLPLSMEENAAFVKVGQGDLFFTNGSPLPILIFVVVVIVCEFLLRKSAICRQIYYTGSNEKAAAYSGIKTDRVKIAVLMISGFLCGIGGVIYMVRFSGVPVSAGEGFEMTAIASCVIGGVSMNGGRGTVLGAVLGLTFMTLITNAMNLFLVSPTVQELIRYLIVLAAVILDNAQANARAKKLA